MILHSLLALLIAAAPAAATGRDRRPPIDECAADPSFAAFRDELRQAIARRDRDHVLAILADDILVDFGGGAGRADFIRAWTLDRPEESGLWTELGTVLDLGCAREADGSLWAPSLYRQLGDQDDPFTAAIAVRPGAAMQVAPDPRSPVVTTLDWDVLTLLPDDGSDDWTAVALSDGRRGFVARGDLRSAVDYRAGFARLDGRWRMIVFVAGD